MIFREGHTVVITSLALPSSLASGRGGAGEGVGKGNVDCAKGGDGGGRGDGRGAAGGEDVGGCAEHAIDELLEQTVGLRQPRRHGHKGQEDGTDAGHGEAAGVDAAGRGCVSSGMSDGVVGGEMIRVEWMAETYIPSLSDIVVAGGGMFG